MEKFMVIALQETGPFLSGFDGHVTMRTLYATQGIDDCFRYCSPQILIDLTPIRCEIVGAEGIEEVHTIFPGDSEEEQREAMFEEELACLTTQGDSAVVPFDTIVDHYKLARVAEANGRNGAWTIDDMAQCMRVPHEVIELDPDDSSEIAEGKPWYDTVMELEAEGAIAL
jgi:hypothetical protein